MPDTAPLLPTRPPEAFLALQHENARRWRLAGKSDEDIVTGLKDVAEKCGMDWDDGYMPFGGATSFADIDQFKTAAAAESATYELTFQFQAIVNNLFRADELSLAQKSERIIAASRDLRRRLGLEVDAAVADAGGTRSLKDRILGRPGNPRAAEPNFTPPPDLAQSAADSISTASATGPAQEAGFRAFKDVNGDWRWLAIWSNTFKDRQDESFHEGAHKDFVEFVDREKAFPELWPWHLPARMGVADMVDFVQPEGFMVATGPFDKGMEHAADALSKMGALGVSHGYEYPRKSLVDGVYHQYRTYEISPLPIGSAANQYTGFLAAEVIAMPMTPEKKAFAEGLLGSAKVAELEAILPLARKAADDAGVSFKEWIDSVGAKDDTSTPPPAASGVGVEDLRGIITAALAPMQTAIDALASKQDALDVQVKAIAQSDDAKIAARMAPPAPNAAAMFIASQAKESVASERAADVKAAKDGLSADSPLADLPEHLRSYVGDIFKVPTGAGA